MEWKIEAAESVEAAAVVLDIPTAAILSEVYNDLVDRLGVMNHGTPQPPWFITPQPEQTSPEPTGACLPILLLARVIPGEVHGAAVEDTRTIFEAGVEAEAYRHVAYERCAMLAALHGRVLRLRSLPVASRCGSRRGHALNNANRPSVTITNPSALSCFRTVSNAESTLQ